MSLDKYKPRTVQERIDGLTYTSDKLPAAVGITTGIKVARLLGEGLLSRLFDGSIWSLADALMVNPSEAAAKLEERVVAEAARMRNDGVSEEDTAKSIEAMRAEHAKRLQDLDLARQDAAAQSARLIETLAIHADRIGFEDLAMQLLSGMRVDQLRPMGSGHVAASREAFDAHFAGEYIHLLKVIVFAIKHNFAGPTLGSLSMSGSPGTPTDGPASTEASSPRTSTPR